MSKRFALLAACLAFGSPTSAAPAPSPHMANWVNCMRSYSDPRLRSDTVEQIIEGSLGTCFSEKLAARQFYIDQFGAQKGSAAFERLQAGMRAMMRERLTAMKRGLAECEAASGRPCGVTGH